MTYVKPTWRFDSDRWTPDPLLDARATGKEQACFPTYLMADACVSVCLDSKTFPVPSSDQLFAQVMNLLEKIYAADRLGLLAIDEARDCRYLLQFIDSGDDSGDE